MSSRNRQAAFTEINITPLTDIFLVLLIIMMVIAPMLDNKGLKLATPSLGADSGVTEDPKALTIQINADGSYLADGQASSLTEISGKLSMAKVEYPDGLIIKPQAQATHGAMVAVMDLARTKGLSKIAVVQAE